MRSLLVCVGFVLITKTLSNYIDVFETTNGHEPQVAINCDHIPFYIDLETGAWVSDSEGVTRCDKKKEKVLKYCKHKYPQLNITNIVEANKPVKFNNWCVPGHAQCEETKKVVPYRCLVREYEADALMVPQNCKFDHIHNEDMCLSHDGWKEQAAHACKRKYSMELMEYGILLPCETDMFTGVEYVCCPKDNVETEQKFELPNYDIDDLPHAIRKFQKYLPLETKGCDRSTYITKQTAMEDHHRKQIAAVVEEWDEAEKRYNELKPKDPVAAEEKMRRTLEVFRQTLAALEKEAKDEKSRLRAEHATCINTQIAKNKRDAMISYLAAIEEEPVNAEKILSAVRKFIQVCEHDRVHSLRHFEHVRNRDPKKADTIRGELLQHLKGLNKVVNESMALLNYLPDIAEQFGLKGHANTIILKPKTGLPEDDHSAEDHKRVQTILEAAAKKYNNVQPTEKQQVPTDLPAIAADGEPAFKLITKEYGSVQKEHKENEDEDFEHDDDEDTDDELHEVWEEKENENLEIMKELKKLVNDDEKHHKDDHHHHSPFAFNAVIGLSCGVLLIMLFLVVAMVVRKRRMTRARVVLAENNDEREHLVEMQKNGFENPTYKFYYY